MKAEVKCGFFRRLQRMILFSSDIHFFELAIFFLFGIIESCKCRDKRYGFCFAEFLLFLIAAGQVEVKK